MQYNINVANGTGMEVRTNLNLAHQSLATNFFGATDPSLMSPVCAFPGSTWADTGNGLLKVRKADNSDWIVIGTIESDGTPKITSNGFTVNASDVVNTPSGTISATNVQDAINELASESGLNLRKPSTAYAVGDIAYSALLPSWAYIECTVGGTTDSGELPVPSSVVVNDTFADGTVEWTVKKVGDTALTEYTKTVNSPMFNKRDVVTTSGTYTAPVTGWYKITAKGGGGAGGGGYYSSSVRGGAGGGGEGGTTIAYINMTAGDTATVVIGAGGTGVSSNIDGTDGGGTSVTFNGNTYTAGGGGGGKKAYGTNELAGGVGGTGTIVGCAGGGGELANWDANGGSGGGAGGGVCSRGGVYITNGTTGGGGAGGSGSSSSGAGGNGFVWFEYFATI